MKLKRRRHFNDPDYEWNAFYRGNPIQKWWKKSIAGIVWSYVDNQSKILEVGCGSSPIIARYPGAVGIDINKDKIKFMRGKCSHISFMRASGDHIPFGDSTFDRVLCLEVVEHVYNPVALFQEINRVLVPAGRLILATPNYGTFTWLMVEKLYGLFLPGGYVLDHYNAFNKTGIIRMAEYNGFALDEIKTVGFSDLVMLFTKKTP